MTTTERLEAVVRTLTEIYLDMDILTMEARKVSDAMDSLRMARFYIQDRDARRAVSEQK